MSNILEPGEDLGISPTIFTNRILSLNGPIRSIYIYIYWCAELYAGMQHADDFKGMITAIILFIELSCASIYFSYSYRYDELDTGYTLQYVMKFTISLFI